MKGQILGFDGAAGAITGEDGARYSFTLADWKGATPPKPRDTIDFVANAGTAQDIYPVQSGFSGFGGSLGGGSAGAAPALKFIAERPQVILEALAILAMLLPFAVNVVKSMSALSFPGETGSALSQINQGIGQMSQSLAGGGFGQTQVPAIPSTGWLQFTAILSYLLYAIPLIAAFAIFREATNQRMRVLEIVLSGLCVGSFLIFILNVKAMESLALSFGVPTPGMGFGVGGFVLVICGILLGLTWRGIIKRTPGL